MSLDIFSVDEQFSRKMPKTYNVRIFVNILETPDIDTYVHMCYVRIVDLILFCVRFFTY